MVEVLAAGLSGANWSLDAPPFTSGSKGPGTGLFVLALDPRLFDRWFEERMRTQLRRLSERYRVHIPGLAKAAARARSAADGVVVPRAVHDAVARRAAGQS